MIHQTTTEGTSTIGIDLGKSTFHLIGMDARGRIVLRRKLRVGSCPSRPCVGSQAAAAAALHELARVLNPS